VLVIFIVLVVVVVVVLLFCLFILSDRIAGPGTDVLGGVFGGVFIFPALFRAVFLGIGTSDRPRDFIFCSSSSCTK
jgi:hypothetical protein